MPQQHPDSAPAPVQPGEPFPERRAGPRRRGSLWSVLYGGLRPRRREGRRVRDHDEVLLDWHQPGVMFLALAILLMSCTDALFTLNLLAVGGEELNVFMDALIGHDVAWFLAIKIGLTAVSVVLLVIGANRRFLGRIRVLRLMQLFCIGYVVLIAYEIVLLRSVFA